MYDCKFKMTNSFHCYVITIIIIVIIIIIFIIIITIAYSIITTI